MRYLVLSGFFVCATTHLMPIAAYSDALEVTLKEGDYVPVFEAKSANGEVWRSQDHVGKKYIVVYFYPADLTGNCTRQACGFRDQMKEFEEAGVEVVGISGDCVDNHKIFSRVNSLNFSLLSDEDGKISKAFGVPFRDGATIMKVVDGIEISLVRGVTASRWTFLIDTEGRIIHKNTAVDAEHDSKNILETVRRLTSRAE